MSPRDTRTARELIAELRGRGVSVTEIAAELQRSPRMVRKVINGETPGRGYQATLLDLATTGTSSRVPPRRRGASGELVPVRTKQGAATKSAPPMDTGGRYTNDRQGGRLRTTTYLGGGGRMHDLRIPKGRQTKGRAVASDEITRTIRSAAKGQARDSQKLVKTRVTYSNGRVMEVNEYNASTMLKRINEHPGSALDWFLDENANRYPNFDVSKETITGVSLTVYDAPKTDEYERQGLRKRRRRPNTGWKPNY